MDDGLLNGATQQTKPRADLYDPGAFITSDDLQDVDNDGNVNDPGWILLGKFDEQADGSEGQSYATINNGYEGSLDVGDYLSIDFTCDSSCLGSTSGIWSLNFLTTKDELLDALVSAGLGDSFFDHLAISFKGPSDTGFSVFDFNFNDINELTSGAFDLSEPHNLGGFYDVSNALQGQGLSHISVWARDPADTPNDVPTPAPLALLCLGLVAISLTKRKAT